MKKLLTASVLVIGTVYSAYAADLRPAYRSPPPPPPPPPNWTGFYIGGNIGYAWGSNSKTTTGDGVAHRLLHRFGKRYSPSQWRVQRPAKRVQLAIRPRLGSSVMKAIFSTAG